MPSKPLHIGIEARYLFAQAKTGIENYTSQLVLHLGRLPELPPITLYTDTPPKETDAVTAEILRTPSLRVRVVPRRRLWLKVWLPRAARRDGVTVMHFPGSILSLLRPYRTVTTIYDLCNVRFPLLAVGNEARLMQGVVRKSALAATRVIAISQATADDVAELYGVPRERIVVTPLAPDPRFRPVPDAAAQVAARYGLRPPYLLFVGTPYPRKNLSRVLDALAQLGPAGKGVTLAIASRKEDAAAEVLARARILGVADRVCFLAGMPDEEMPALYSAAQMLVHPALCEGYGLTLVEAMACATPVITANRSSMLEVAGDAALLVNPEKPGEIADAIRRLLTDPGAREACIRRGTERIAGLTWESTARRTLDAYRAAYEGK
ncbi:MAG TPA: glycosyltransferase family 4 protein [Armatimonadetes bacterium]|jgi:glycosyltransferase involved in cell wall biosynthesis|nr:glycosyltransferase family 4 protein [Armatimonadota bacterium]